MRQILAEVNIRGQHRPRPRRILRRVILAIVLLPVFYYLLCVAGFVYLRFLPPLPCPATRR